MHISIYLGGATAPNSVAVNMFHGTITKESEKALYIQADNTDKGIWIPKKALIGDLKEGSVRIAKWFQTNEYQNWYLNRYSNISATTVDYREGKYVSC